MKKATENTGQKQPAENLVENSENNSHSGEKELTVLNRMIEGTPFMMRWEKEKGYSWGMAGIIPPFLALQLAEYTVLSLLFQD